MNLLSCEIFHIMMWDNPKIVSKFGIFGIFIADFGHLSHLSQLIHL